MRTVVVIESGFVDPRRPTLAHRCRRGAVTSSKPFYDEMPDEFRRIEHPDGSTEPIIPARIRQEGDSEVAVGRHLPPSSGRVAAFMDHFDRRFQIAARSASGRIIAIASAHHRLNYIHPFPDGNGRAGSADVLQMHGALLRAKCAGCGVKWQAALIMTADDTCPSCGAKACRPDIVWFGESPYHMAEIRAAIAACDLFVVIGSSGTVYPAAGFASTARECGIRTLSINLDHPAGASSFDERMIGSATRVVPSWVKQVLGAV